MFDDIVAQGAIIVLTALGSIVLYGLKKFFKLLSDKFITDTDLKVKAEALSEAVLAGMAKAQVEVVREAKRKAADGKLTKDEVVEALSVAKEEAITVAKSDEVKTVLMEMSTYAFDSLVKSQLKKISNG